MEHETTECHTPSLSPCSHSSSSSSPAPPAVEQKTLHIAPMLNYSNREFRQLLRILTRRATLWTEMVAAETIVAKSSSVSDPNHNKNNSSTNHQNPVNHHRLEEHLAYHPSQHPITCQIGGNDPLTCGQAAAIVQQYGYDAIDFNVDCPSQRVAGKMEFGAALLYREEVTRGVMEEIRRVWAEEEVGCGGGNSGNGGDGGGMDKEDDDERKMPISIKTRIGVDQHDSLSFITNYLRTISPVCTRFVLHARKCMLGGVLDARGNRNIPPLNYPRVYEICRSFPRCDFWINGGIKTLKEARDVVYGIGVVAESDDGITCKQHTVPPCQTCNLPNGSCIKPPTIAPPNLRGCMMGRAAVEDPCLFWDTDRYFYNEPSNPCRTRREVLEKYCLWLEETYPRRCGDDDERVTFEYPAPVVLGGGRDGPCCVCRDVYDDDGGTGVDTTNEKALSSPSLNPSSTPTPTPPPKKTKIAGRIIARSLRPVQGVFAGIPDTRIFRRTCDRLSLDQRVRNCGPGYILRKAMESLPDGVLDLEFVRADAL